MTATAPRHYLFQGVRSVLTIWMPVFVDEEAGVVVLPPTALMVHESTRTKTMFARIAVQSSL